MAKSRMALRLVLLGAAVPASAAPLTAEEAIAVQERRLESALGLDCRRGGDEIVVCGQGGRDPNRIPLPDERLPGERGRMPPGETGPAVAAMAAGGRDCTGAHPGAGCGATIEFFRVGIVLFKIGRHLLDPE